MLAAGSGGSLLGSLSSFCGCFVGQVSGNGVSEFPPSLWDSALGNTHDPIEIVERLKAASDALREDVVGVKRNEVLLSAPPFGCGCCLSAAPRNSIVRVSTSRRAVQVLVYFCLWLTARRLRRGGVLPQ